MNTLEQKAHIYKSLGDETRLSIARKLAQAQGEVRCSDIVSDCAAMLKLSQPTMSYHFQTLVHAQVLIQRKEGVEKYYQLNHKVLAAAGIDTAKL